MTTKRFITSLIQIEFTVEHDYIRAHYNSRYASGSIPIQNPQDMVHVIDELCGKGSYCLYEGPKDKYPKAVDYLKSRDIVFPKITYWQQGIKTDVIEQARNAGSQLWGDIEEMEIGWLEHQCQSYIEDLPIDK